MNHARKTEASECQIGRREFLASAAAATYLIASPLKAHAAQANSALELGMIGCGGRGKWIAKLFQDNINCKFVACADYFQDRVDEFGTKYNVEPSRRFTTLSGYKKLLEGKLDAVVIESPPYCHPEQAAAAVDAGRHVFLAKPVAVDVPGCQTIEESGKKASANKQVFLVDFQTRTNDAYKEAVKKVHEGAIGDIFCGETYYHFPHDPARAHASPEDRIRYWYSLIELSGDFIVEQNIHALDVMTWLMNQQPTGAVGSGGRTKRKAGDIWDHFQMLYTFEKGITVAFTGTQCVPKSPDNIRCRLFGSAGVVDTDYYGRVEIVGEHPYAGAKMKDLYTEGAVANIKDFAKHIETRTCDNVTVAPSVRSNLTAILGRECAYQKKPMTWDDMMKAAREIPFSKEGLKA